VGSSQLQRCDGCGSQMTGCSCRNVPRGSNVRSYRSGRDTDHRSTSNGPTGAAKRHHKILNKCDSSGIQKFTKPPMPTIFARERNPSTSILRATRNRCSIVRGSSNHLSEYLHNGFRVRHKLAKLGPPEPCESRILGMIDNLQGLTFFLICPFRWRRCITSITTISVMIATLEDIEPPPPSSVAKQSASL
jgi:hypothetical protein